MDGRTDCNPNFGIVGSQKGALKMKFVTETNKALADGWQHLDQSVIAVHEVSNNIKLAPLYTVWLIKEVHENAM